MDLPKLYFLKAENRKIEGHPKINVDQGFPRGREQKYRVSLEKKDGGILPGIEKRETPQYKPPLGKSTITSPVQRTERWVNLFRNEREKDMQTRLLASRGSENRKLDRSPWSR
jgi:hypothetical protein